MPRGYPASYTEQIHASDARAAVHAVTITKDGWAAPIRITDDAIGMEYDGDTYKAANFQFTEPSDQDETPTAQLVFGIRADVDDLIALGYENAQVEVSVVTRADKTRIWPKSAPATYTISTLRFTADGVALNLIYAQIANVTAIRAKYDPQTFPGLYR